MRVPELIYCAGKNIEFAQIAIEAGFTYGAQLPNKVYFPPEFVDQNWKAPNLEQYAVAVAEYRPRLATVLDWEYPDQLNEVLVWAETIAPFVKTIIIIPKVFGGIAQLPRQIGGKPVRLGYSVPTKFGGTQVPAWEFYGWPVHLLGGAPHVQFEIMHYLDVASVDGNMHQLMATKYGAFFDPAKSTRRGFWPSLLDYDGEKWGDGGNEADAPAEAFRRSCQNIMAMWAGLPMFDRPDSRAVGNG